MKRALVMCAKKVKSQKKKGFQCGGAPPSLVVVDDEVAFLKMVAL